MDSLLILVLLYKNTEPDLYWYLKHLKLNHLNYLSEFLYRVLPGSKYMNCYFTIKNNLLLSLNFIHKAIVVDCCFYCWNFICSQYIYFSSFTNFVSFFFLFMCYFKIVTIKLHMLFIFVISCVKDWSLY